MTTVKEKFTVPEKPEELEEFIGDQAKLLALEQDDFKAVIHAYAKHMMAGSGEDLKKQIVDETQKTLTDWLKEQGVKRPNMTPFDPVNAARAVAYNPDAIGAKVETLFKSPADYLKSIWYKNLATNPDPRIVDLRNYSETVPDAGGFLVPETLRSEVLRIGLEVGIVRPRARTIPMDSLRVPFPCIDSTTNVGSVYGGFVLSWTPEAGAIALSDARFGRVVLEAWKLTGACVVPNELLQDSGISFAAFVNGLFPEAVTFGEDMAFLNGVGVAQPQGVLNSPATIVVPKQAGQVAGTIVWQNIINMYPRMLPASLGRAVWVASIDTFPELASMALAVGAGGSAIWINNGAQGPPMTILGRPVIFTEKVPHIGVQGQIGFYDFGYYLIGDRQTMTASSSEHILFQNDETMYKIVERVDGRGWVQSAMTPANAGATLSPFVTLAA